MWQHLNIAAVQESAFGTKRTFNYRPPMSAFGGKADVAFCTLAAS
jgi:hypothetical protein